MNSTKARSWIATLQVVPGDYKLEDFLQCQYSNTPDCVYVCGQLEKGSHYHIQYFMAFSTQKRLAAMKKVCPQTHWEPVVRNNGADDYCMKEDTRVEGPFEFGTKPIRQNKKRDMKARNKEILRLGPVEAVKEGLIDVCKFRQAVSSITLYQLMADMPSEEPVLTSQWHYGPTGTGKSFHCRAIFGNSLFIKSNDIWWDGYEGQETVLIEELGPKQIGGHHLKIWADHYPFKAAIKGGQILIRPKRIVVTSNYPLAAVYPEPQDHLPLERRFVPHHHTDPFKPKGK